MKYYAIYDNQLQGFKAQLAFCSHEEALEAGLNRVYSIHQDIFEDEELKSSNFEELKVEFGLDDEGLVNFCDYSIQEVTEGEYTKINKSDEIGLTKIAYLR